MIALQKISEFITGLITNEFTGEIVIKFNNGRIDHIRKTEDIGSL